VRVITVGTSHALHGVPLLGYYLRRAKPEALLASRIRVNVAALRARRWFRSPTRVYATIDTHLSQQLGSQSARKRESQMRYMRLYYPSNDGIIAVSQGVAQDFAQLLHWQVDRLTVIPNPIVTPELSSLALAPIDHPWLGEGDPPLIMGAGRIEPQKDFPMLIRAFARVRERRPCRLMILGEGSSRPAIERLAGELGVARDVAMPGFVVNPYAYLSRAQLFVLSSAWEGLPTVLAEALALGVPVVATDCPSGPREILDDGRYGALVPVGDAEALAEAMERTLDDPLDPEFLRSAAQRYTVESSARQYLAVMGFEHPLETPQP
jgi:glycosyltransferase involved in cell wall biosynthesis